MPIYTRHTGLEDELINTHTARMMLKGNIPMVPVFEEDLTPWQFLRLDEEELEEARGIRFIPPVIGTFGFGTFHIDYEDPVFRPINAPRRAPLAY
jgi:hypothetical protein